MSRISTHVLDTALGRPAKGLDIELSVLETDGSWLTLKQGSTDADGRILDILAGAPLQKCTYRLSFATAAYLQTAHGSAFFPRIEIVFSVTFPEQHHHIPLLLSPFGYSTYRGS
jgi:5-hydroxyisourate hydrolase